MIPDRLVICDKKSGFAIAAAPKVGTLSIVQWFFEIRCGRKPGEGGEGNHRWLKQAGLPMRLQDVIQAGIPIIAVHRDPYERIRSAYQHRVVREREADAWTFRDFCEQLGKYRENASIAWHTDPQVQWLGPDIGVFAASLGLDQLTRLPVLLAHLTGKTFPEIEWRHRMAAKPAWEPDLKEILAPWVRADLEAGWNGETPPEVLQILHAADPEGGAVKNGAKELEVINLDRYHAVSRWGWYRKFATEWRQWVASPLPSRVLEIGAFDGVSANVMLDSIFTHPESTVDAIDAYLPDSTSPLVYEATRGVFEDNQRRGGHGDRIRLHHGFSRDVLARMWLDGLGESFDAVYVDGGHTAPDVLTDAVLAWPLLKPDGTLVFDDFKWGDDRPKTLRPREGVTAFESAFGRDLIPLHRGYQRIYRKVGVTGGLRNRAGGPCQGTVVIVGAYNSGSSMLSLMMECLGFDLGRPTWEDFGESASFRRILIEAFDEKQVLRMIQSGNLVERLKKWMKYMRPHAGALCLKHPLTGMFLPEIEEAFGEDIRFLRIHRPLDESIQRLTARQWFPEPERLQRMLHKHTESFFSNGKPCHKVNYHELKREPAAELRRLSDEMDVVVTDFRIERASRMVRKSGESAEKASRT